MLKSGGWYHKIHSWFLKTRKLENLPDSWSHLNTGHVRVILDEKGFRHS